MSRKLFRPLVFDSPIGKQAEKDKCNSVMPTVLRLFLRRFRIGYLNGTRMVGLNKSGSGLPSIKNFSTLR